MSKNVGKTEKCKQCGATAEKHPVIAVMSKTDGGEEGSIGEGFRGAFRAYPMCDACWKAPKLKAHYYMRDDEEIALRLAGMPNLQMPGKTK